MGPAQAWPAGRQSSGGAAAAALQRRL